MLPIRFVSLGPGDPGLITLKALRALTEANDIFCPETLLPDGTSSSRAADIIARLQSEETSRTAEALFGPLFTESTLHRFPLPMSRDRRKAHRAYDAVCTYATALARSGRRVCVACEGDASFYSSIHFIYDRLQAQDVPVEIIAGVPAFIAASSRAGLHTTEGDQRLTIIAGNATAQGIAELVGQGQTVVVMKPSRCADELRRCLSEHPDFIYHYFEQVGTPLEVYLSDREQIRLAAFPYWSMLFITAS